MRVEVDPGFFEIAGTSGKARVSQAHLGLATDVDTDLAGCVSGDKDTSGTPNYNCTPVKSEYG